MTKAKLVELTAEEGEQLEKLMEANDISGISKLLKPLMEHASTEVELPERKRRPTPPPEIVRIMIDAINNIHYCLHRERYKEAERISCVLANMLDLDTALMPIDVLFEFFREMRALNAERSIEGCEHKPGHA